jgi:hypothetical protein
MVLYKGFEISISLDHGILEYKIVRQVDQQCLRSGKGSYKGKLKGYLPALKQHVDKLREIQNGK